ALAAVKLAHESSGVSENEDDIPQARLPRATETDKAGPRADNGRRGGKPQSTRGPAGKGVRGATTRLYIGLGRAAGVRPQDLVGAIAGESPLSGRDIGAIEIADRHSLVEVPEGSANAVIAALKGVV